MKLNSQFLFKLLIFVYTTINSIICYNPIRRQYRLQRTQKESHFNQALQSLAYKIGYKIRNRKISSKEEIDKLMKSAWDALKQQKSMTEIETLQNSVSDAYKPYFDKFTNEDDPQLKLLQKELGSFLETFQQGKEIYLELKEIEFKLDEAQHQVANETDTELQSSKVEAQDREVQSLEKLQLDTLNKFINHIQKQNNVTQDELHFNKGLIMAIENSLPPQFCWQSTSTSLPQNCPERYKERSLALCYETCEQGQEARKINKDLKFVNFMNVCVEQCNSKDSNECEKKLFIIYPQGKKKWRNFRIQKSFIPSSITNFNKLVTCASDEDKKGALCVKKSTTCGEKGYVKCGPFACSIDTATCYDKVSSMTLQTIIGLTKFISLFIAPGVINIFEYSINLANGAVKITQAVDSIKQLIIKAFTSKVFLLQVYDKEKLRNKLIEDASNYVINNEKNKYGTNVFTKEEIYEKIKTELEKQVVMIVEDQIFKEQQTKMEKLKSIGAEAKKLVTKYAPIIAAAVGVQVGGQAGLKAAGVTNESVLKIFEVTTLEALANTLNDCKSAAEDKNAETKKQKLLTCASTITGLISIFDPTGFTGIAKAFMYSQCD